MRQTRLRGTGSPRVAAPVDGAAIAECQNVSVCYRSGRAEHQALAGVTCCVRLGDMIGIIGPSGSGKTTLLHVLAGLEHPGSGSVSWPALGARPSSRIGRVSLAFQSPSLVTALDVAENVALPLVLAGVDERAAREQALGALERLELDPLCNQLPEELSGGQAQRVGLARALVSRPSMLLCDEPTGQVDAETGSALLEVLLADAAERKSAVVIATHDAAIIDRLAARWSIADGCLNVVETQRRDGGGER